MCASYIAVNKLLQLIVGKAQKKARDRKSQPSSKYP